jgi:hypothetical protein
VDLFVFGGRIVRQIPVAVRRAEFFEDVVHVSDSEGLVVTTDDRFTIAATSFRIIRSSCA